MSYTAYCNGTKFFDTAVNDATLTLTATQLDIASMSQGSFVFSVPPSNVCYNSFEKYTSYVDVYDNDDLIFCGRVAQPSKDFDNLKIITCEGLMTVFADTVLEPVLFDGYLHTLVTQIITNHNQQVVYTDKQILIGTMSIPNSDCYRDYQVNESSISRLQDLNNSYGGYMRIRKATNGDLYFDWVADFTDGCEQSIDFGENLIDLLQEENTADFCTVLLPLGAILDDGTRVTIESVNNGSKYLEASAQVIQQYGRIYKIQEWDDVNVPSILLTKAQNELTARLTPSISITVYAADLAKAGYSIDGFRTWQKLKVMSAPHGIDGIWMNCNSLSVDFLSPESFQLMLGTNQTGYIQSTYNSNRELIEGIINQFPTKGRLQEAIDDLTSMISGGAGNGFIVQRDTNNDGVFDEVLIMDTPSIETAVKVWRYNLSGWAYSESGYEGPYITGTTFDGGMLAKFINATELFAENITATNFNLVGGSININSSTTQTAPSLIKFKHTYSNIIASISVSANAIHLSEDNGTTIRTTQYDDFGLIATETNKSTGVVVTGINAVSGGVRITYNDEETIHLNGIGGDITLKGGIYYSGASHTQPMITFRDSNTTYGHDIVIDGGGTVVIGSGESGYTHGFTQGEERLYLYSDDAILLQAGAQTFSNRKGISIGSDGNIYPIVADSASNNTRNIGSSTYKFANVYATNFHGTSVNMTGDGWFGDASQTATKYTGVTNNLNNACLAVNGGGNGNAGMYHRSVSGHNSNFWITYVNTAGNVTRNNSSDRRMKDEVGIISDQEAQAVLSVTPINFTYKNDDPKNINSGIYAQDLRDVLKEAGIGYRSYLQILDNTSEDGDTYYDLDHNEDDVLYGIDYSKIVPVLMKGWQMHEQKISELEERLAKMEAMVETLMNR